MVGMYAVKYIHQAILFHVNKQTKNPYIVHVNH